ncbi:MAG: hypothetical protein ACOCRK_05755 [bacterium]
MITRCDICNENSKQENLINIDPALFNEVGDLKQNYEYFDGMVCPECYYKEMVTEEFARGECTRLFNLFFKKG